MSEPTNLLRFDSIDVYTTCPQSKESTPQEYLREVTRVARWSDGCAGMLIYSDNSILDAWLVAQHVLAHTTDLRPLVAVQPLYMHPYAVAKMVTSLAYMYDRPIALNMIAGGFKTDLESLCDPVAHDDRYARLIEYWQIIQLLLSGDVVTHLGQFYQVRTLKLTPPLPAHLRPTLLMSGSSPAGRAAVAATGATGVEYPEPPTTETAGSAPDYPRGIRIGILARSTQQQAQQVAKERFPPNRRGQLERQMATKKSDSSWHHQLSQAYAGQDAYSLEPFQYGYTSCPYLIGDHSTVAAALAYYLRLGYKTFILDIPRSSEDVMTAATAFSDALKLVSHDA